MIGRPATEVSETDALGHVLGYTCANGVTHADTILCGTSLGVGSMKPGSDIEIEIAGIGKLTNRFE